MCPDQGSPARSARRINSEDDGDRRTDERIASIVHRGAVDGEPITQAVEAGGQWL